MTSSPRRSQARTADAVLAFTVAIVLADSSIVTLGLPDVLRDFGASVSGVAWVLIVFNVVLAAAVIPATALAGRIGAARIWTIGLIAFALASLACALAPSLGVLIGARVLQAVGGAAVLAGAIELLAAHRGSHSAAATAWGPAGVAGLALGPALGGLLTELLAWEAIFALQVPVILLAFAARRAAPRRRPLGRQDASARRERRARTGLGGAHRFTVSAGRDAHAWLGAHAA